MFLNGIPVHKNNREQEDRRTGEKEMVVQLGKAGRLRSYSSAGLARAGEPVALLWW